MEKTRRREFFKTVGVAAIGGSCLMKGMGNIHAQEKPNLTSKSKEFSPGEKVPASGIYDVTHDKLDGDDHALPHLVIAIAGKVFPPCRLCSGEVRFVLHQAAVEVDTDVHFRSWRAAMINITLRAAILIAVVFNLGVDVVSAQVSTEPRLGPALPEEIQLPDNPLTDWT